MDIKKDFDNYERVEKAAKELIRAVMWEYLDIAQGEEEKVLDKVIDDCAERHGDSLIEHTLLVVKNVYTEERIEKMIK